MLKIRRPIGRLIFNMGIATLGKTVFLIETAPWLLARICSNMDHLRLSHLDHLRTVWGTLNSLRPRQHGRHFADDSFKCIFLNENVWILLTISLKFVPKVQINNFPAFVQIMAWCHPGDKPLSEPMMISLPMHICVTRPQRVNSLALERCGSNFLNTWYELISWALSLQRNPQTCLHFLYTHTYLHTLKTPFGVVEHHNGDIMMSVMAS